MSQLKSIAFPKEHGGWVMLTEAMVVGFSLNPSVPAVLLGMAAVLGFFLVNPAGIWLRDRINGRILPRTVLAFRIASVYLASVLVLLGVSFVISTRPFWVPLVPAATVFAAQIIFSLRREEKTLGAEISGGVAIGAVAAAILIAGGFSLTTAFVVWGVLAVRAVTSVIFVRQKLRQARQQPYSQTMVWGIHLIGTLGLLCLDFTAGLPTVIYVAYGILFLRAVIGMRIMRKVRPQVVGVQESVFGLINSVLIVAGYF